ncbi:VWA domain-containing protein [Pyruvatibacter sp.]|uniref:VWA domain-containing protein n=1 Tax=Pyruvatibacter sp. TaxID=1981328 RepID=UPI0032F0688D
MADKGKSIDRSAQTGRAADRASVDRFLSKVAATPPPVHGNTRGRLLFIMDATLSRQPTWDTALSLQAQMFDVTASMGGLDVQLAYFRGHGEFRASPWVSEPAALARAMTGVQVRGGHTQICRALRHAISQAREAPVAALVYVGDCMEEAADDVCAAAGELGLLGVRAFMFQEGYEPAAERTFREVARLTGGAFARFDAGAADQLRDLLRAVAVYASGGRRALANHAASGSSAIRQLTHQVK